MKHAFALLLFATSAHAIELALPVACEIGKNCWVQQYVDHDPSTAATDYACGVASYDKHDGTDIRTLHNGVKVDVLAAADGIVKATRDGVDDKLMKTTEDAAAVKGRECGNGVVITHGDGWETQYCHMRKGSMAVRKGDKLSTGTKLGSIGYSGAAAFPHVHITLRKDGKVVDPFTADSLGDCKAADRSLWNETARKQLAYESTTLLDFQWSNHVLQETELEQGPLPDEPLASNWPALLAHAWLINLHKDDEVTLTLTIPGIAPVINRMKMDRNRAVQKLHAGKKKRNDWPLGEYQARVEIQRRGVVVLEKIISGQMK